MKDARGGSDSLAESAFSGMDSSSYSSTPRAGPTFAHQRWPSRGGIFFGAQCGELAARGVIQSRQIRAGLDVVVGAPFPLAGRAGG
jgi:hypothetical protein